MLRAPDDGLGGSGSGTLPAGQTGTQNPTTGNVQASPGGQSPGVQTPTTSTGAQTSPQQGANQGGVQGDNKPSQQAVAYQSFAVPQGMSPLSEATQGEVAALAKEMNLSQAQAQKWVDAGAKAYGDGMEAVRLTIEQKYREWHDSSLNDDEIKPYINTEGTLKDIPEFIKRVMGNEADSGKFFTFAKESGIGVSPDFIKFCIRARKLMGEATLWDSSRGTPQKQRTMEDFAYTMFPDMKPK